MTHILVLIGSMCPLTQVGSSFSIDGFLFLTPKNDSLFSINGFLNNDLLNRSSKIPISASSALSGDGERKEGF